MRVVNITPRFDPIQGTIGSFVHVYNDLVRMDRVLSDAFYTKFEKRKIVPAWYEYREYEIAFASEFFGDDRIG